jgi:hypothetical protein
MAKTLLGSSYYITFSAGFVKLHQRNLMDLDVHILFERILRDKFIPGVNLPSRKILPRFQAGP